ncbi:MAG TPA: SRPBCC family protein [Gaiellaceae bacterium]|nr:SRPBCC family protein [Gaiellaceae bacterium]
MPVRTAYNQWTQFEEFPTFMEHVDEVRQLDDRHLHWQVTLSGKTEEFEAEVTEQIPDARIAWKSTSGRTHAGVVDFHRLSDERSEFTVILDAEPHGLLEKAADTVGLAERQLRPDLERFKELIENRGEESGAWRGTVEAETS